MDKDEIVKKSSKLGNEYIDDLNLVELPNELYNFKFILNETVKKIFSSSNVFDIFKKTWRFEAERCLSQY